MYPADAHHDLLTLDEAADALRVSKKTLRRRIDHGELDVLRDRRLVLVPRASLHAYVARHTVRRTQTARTRVSDTRPLSLPPRPRAVTKLWDAAAPGAGA